MRYLLRAIAEFIVIAAVLFLLLLLVVSQLPEPPAREAPPLTPREIENFSSQCEGRTVLVRNKLECR